MKNWFRLGLVATECRTTLDQFFVDQLPVVVPGMFWKLGLVWFPNVEAKN